MQRETGTRIYKRWKAKDRRLLARLRAEKLEMNQSEFADHVGVGLATIQRAEQGKKISEDFARYIAQALSQPLEELFIYDTTVTIPEMAPVARPPALILAVRSDIEAFRQRHPFGLTVFDEFLELHHSPNWRGWRSGEITFEEIGEYEAPPDFEAFLERYKPRFNKSYYSLCGFSPLPTADDEQHLKVYARAGSFHHVYALTQIFEDRQLHKDCFEFRRACEESLLPISRSPLYHNVNCEVILVTKDDHVVLGRRRLGTPFFPGAWTASLEEQMLRYDPSPDARIKRDAGLFECAERGTTGELGITVDPQRPTLLLSVGIEWRNFTAAFIFLVNAAEDFATIRDKCWPQAADRNEAIALDCVSAKPESLRAALSAPEWTPSPWAKADAIVGYEGIGKAVWHPTARARLEAYIQYKTSPH